MSETIFEEIIKQKDEKSLLTSIELIDDFSANVSLIPYFDRISLEILYFLNRCLYGEEQVYHPNYLVWTKATCSLGTPIPYNEMFSKEELLVVQKSFFDQLWYNRFSDFVKFSDVNKLLTFPKRPDLSKTINVDCSYHRDKLSSFQGTFKDEIAGVIDAISPLLIETLTAFYEKAADKKAQEGEVKNSESLRMFKNLIYHMFAQKKDNGYFPTLKVGAGVHAAVRWDKQRLFKENDFQDFTHAQAAIPYCDIFLTEKPLKHLLSTQSLAYDKEYNCTIVATPEESISFIKQTVANKAN